MDLTEIWWEIVDWKHLAQDRDHWWDVINETTNFLVP